MIFYTTGYLREHTFRGQSKPETLRLMVDAMDAILVDIRRRPWSMAPCWRGEALERSLAARYLWVPSLGNVNYNNGGPIRIADLADGTATLEALTKPAILMCGCECYETCHRWHVSRELRRCGHETFEIPHWGMLLAGLAGGLTIDEILDKARKALEGAVG